MSPPGCFFILILGLAQAAQPELFLDLTTPQIKHMDEAKTVGCGGGGGVFVTGQPYRPPQLTATLDIEWLNRARFKLGDEVLGEVRLTNTGDKPVLLPWNPDSDSVYGKDCEDLGKAKPYLEGSLTLKVADSEGRSEIVAGHQLFAVRDDAATYRILAPQQSAHIRVSGKLYLHQIPTNTSSSGPTNHFKVIAAFDLRDSSLPNSYQTVISTNHKDVTVEGM